MAWIARLWIVVGLGVAGCAEPSDDGAPGAGTAAGSTGATGGPLGTVGAGPGGATGSGESGGSVGGESGPATDGGESDTGAPTCDAPIVGATGMRNWADTDLDMAPMNNQHFWIYSDVPECGIVLVVDETQWILQITLPPRSQEPGLYDIAAGDVTVRYVNGAGSGTATVGTLDLEGWGDGGFGGVLCGADLPAPIPQGSINMFDDCF